jgi:hypothetical protein
MLAKALSCGPCWRYCFSLFDSQKVANLIGKFGRSVLVQERINWRGTGANRLIDNIFQARALNPHPDDLPLIVEEQIIEDFYFSYALVLLSTRIASL